MKHVHEEVIKAQPKSISWANIYHDGHIGYPLGSRGLADSFAKDRRSYVLETRDDGTAHLHKVEA